MAEMAEDGAVLAQEPVQEAGDADARVEIGLTADAMKAVVTGFEPARGNGAPLSLEVLNAALASAGVSAGPDAVGARLVLEAQHEGRDPSGLAVARGTPVDPPRDASVEPAGDWNYPVFPGDIIGRLLPAAPGLPGVTVTGKTLPAPEGCGRDLSIGSGLALDKSDNALRATTYGLVSSPANSVDQGERTIQILPLLVVSPDRMQVIGTIYDRDYQGNAVSPVSLRKALTEMGVQVEPDSVAMMDAVFAARAEGKPRHDVVVAVGRPPRAGDDGRFEPAFTFGRSRQAVGETERVDFHECGVIHAVDQGELLGRIIPPEPGVPGIDVLGQPRPARAGKPCTIATGENVAPSADGLEFRAASPGVVVWARNTLAVTELFQVDRDIDFSVGNIRLTKGSVQIKGSVLNGFTVVAPGNVEVGETVGSAVIEAGGDVLVRGGILMNKGGKVSAGGRIMAKFAIGATLESRTDVDIGGEISDCVVMADGKILATRGAGLIVGGRLSCGGGIEANEIGSEVGVVTHLSLGAGFRQNETLVAERKELRATIAKIGSVLGEGDPREILRRAPDAKRRAVAELIKARLDAMRQLKEIDEKLAEDLAAARRTLSAGIKVRGAIHPGTVISMAGKVMEVREPIHHAKVHYDFQSDSIVTSNLS